MLALCREHRLEHRTKHIALCYFLARELQQRGQLRLAYVASEANTADIFTKALALGDHQRFCTLLDCVTRLSAPTLDYDALLAAMYALFVGAEGECYLCVPPNPGIEAAALGATESAIPGTAPAQALHTFTLDSGASRCFFRVSTTLTPLPTPVPISLADSSTVFPCQAVPFGSLSGLHLPLFSTNLVSTTALQDAMVTTTTPGGQRVLICTCTQTGRHLATFIRRPVSSLYTLTAEPPHVAASAQVSASPPALACLALPSLCRGAAARHSPILLVSPDDCSPADPPHGLREDLPFLCLHYDKGGEFSPDLLRDFCHGEGILQSFTLLASLQQNGVVERRIGLVMETSPTLRWTGKVGDASVFRVWGSRAFVRDSSADKLSSRAILCDVTFDESVPFYHLFPYRIAPLPPPPLFLAPGPPPVDPLPPHGPAPLGVSQVDPLPLAVPVEVAVDSSAARGAASGGSEPASAVPGEGAEPKGAESEGAESGGAEPRGATSAGGAGAAGPGGARTNGAGAAWAGGVGGAGAGDRGAGGTGAGDLGAGGTGGGGAGGGCTGAGGAGASSSGGAGVTAEARGTGGAGAAGFGGAHTGGTGAAGAGGIGGAGNGDPRAGGTGAGGSGAGGDGAGDAGAGGTCDGGAGAGGTGARGTGAGGAGAGGTGARDHGVEGVGTGVAGAGGTGAGGTVQRRPFFVPPQPSSLPPPDSVLRQVLGLPSSTGLPPSLLCPPPHKSQPQLQPDSPLPAPSPYDEQTDSLTERREPASRPSSPLFAMFTLVVVFLVRVLLLAPALTLWHFVLPLFHCEFPSSLLLRPLFLAFMTLSLT
ncbi:unnamed protein product [Closterium sp. NIES-54]